MISDVVVEESISSGGGKKLFKIKKDTIPLLPNEFKTLLRSSSLQNCLLGRVEDEFSMRFEGTQRT